MGDTAEADSKPRKQRRRDGAVRIIALLTCITASFLWIHSQGSRVLVQREAQHEHGSIEVDRGILSLHWYLLRDRTYTSTLIGAWDFADERHSPWENPAFAVPPPNAFLGFGLQHENVPVVGGVTDSITILAIPLWFIVAVSGAVVAIPTIRQWRRNRALSTGRCLTCGYNLTGNFSNVCPECGSAVTV